MHSKSFMMNQILFLLLGATLGSILTWIVRKLLMEKDYTRKSTLENAERQLAVSLLDKGRLEERLSFIATSEQTTKNRLKQTEERLEEANNSVIRQEAQNKALQEKLDTQKNELEEISRKFENEFKILAGNILDEKTRSFNAIQETSLKTILDPLKTNIKEFKEEFENKLNNEAREKGSLSAQIKQMMELNLNLSTQADNLTKALSNNVKQQGDWGEGILESILQHSGLQKDIQYFVQQSSQNTDGGTIRPDIIVKYPDGRSLVIDSKVSLVHHTRYCASETAEEQALHRGQLLGSVKQHIDGLSRKDYQSVADALDFIIMFVPNEGAYITAMQADMELWQFAYKKRVLLISPTNLIPAMKLVADMWQKDAVNRNAVEIAEKAGKVYDKLAGFIDNFEKVGSQLDKAHETWHEAQKQLWKGKGNLLSQAEQMKKLKVKTGKQLPPVLIDQAMFEDGVMNQMVRMK